MSEPLAPAKEADSRPERAGLVLASLIAVATVANLNLSVANVAIPEIGDDFDSSQTMLNLIAVGYSFGLAASVLWFGALGDRYGRKLLIVVGMTLSIPVSLPGRIRMERRRALRCPRGRRALRRHGLPDHARADHRPLVGTHPDQVDRSLVGDRRRLRRARAARERDPPRVLRLGVGLPRHHPAGAHRARDGRVLRAQPRQRDDRAGRQPRRNRLRRARGRPDPLDQLLARERHGDDGARPVCDRGGGDACSSSSGSGVRAIRSTTSRSRPGRRSGSLRAPGSSSSERSWEPRT